MADFTDAIFTVDDGSLLLGPPDTGESDSNPPLLTMTPAGGTVLPRDAITIEAADDQALALVTVYSADRVIYDGTSFTPDYRTSTKTYTASGFILVVRRVANMPEGEAFSIEATALDEGGNLVRVLGQFGTAVSVGTSTPGSGPAALSKPRRWIDARTRDWLVEVGDYKQDDGFTSKVVLALGTKRGTCQAHPSFGSMLHLVKHADERGRRLSESYALLAVQHLSDEVRDLKATAELDPKWPGLIFITVSGRRGTTTVYAKYTARV